MAAVYSRLLHLRTDYIVRYQFLVLQMINKFIPHGQVLKDCYRLHMTQTPVHMLTQMSPLYMLPVCFCQVHINIFLSFKSVSGKWFSHGVSTHLITGIRILLRNTILGQVKVKQSHYSPGQAQRVRGG